MADKVTISQMMDSVPSSWPWPLIKSCLVKLDKRTSNWQEVCQVSTTQETQQAKPTFLLCSSYEMPAPTEQMDTLNNKRYFRKIPIDSLVTIQIRSTDKSNILSYAVSLAPTTLASGMRIESGLSLGSALYAPLHTFFIAGGNVLFVDVEDINTMSAYIAMKKLRGA